MSKKYNFDTSDRHIIIILTHIRSVMRYISSLFLLLLISSSSFAQIVNPVHWSWKVEKMTVSYTHLTLPTIYSV